MKKKKFKLVLKPWVRVVMLIILTVLFSFSIYNIYYGYNPNKNNLSKYTYTRNSDADYKVYLLKNDFYEEKFLPKGKSYTADLIDYIMVDFKYLYNGSQNTNMNYTYDISATIIGEYKNSENGDSELWKKKYTLLEKQNKLLYDRTSFDINQSVRIDYKTFNSIVEDFKSKLKLGIDAYLNVKLNITYNNELSGSFIKNKDSIEVHIPLNTALFNISTSYNKTKTDTLSEENMTIKNDSKIKIGFISLGITIILGLLFIPQILRSRKKDNYIAKLKKIMKTYSNIIVEVETEFDFEDLEILDIKTFEDIVDIEEEIKSPILYYEIEEDEESWFVITTDKYLYRYILRR